MKMKNVYHTEYCIENNFICVVKMALMDWQSIFFCSQKTKANKCNILRKSNVGVWAGFDCMLWVK